METYEGLIEREPWIGRSPRKVEKDRDSESGLISYEVDGEKKTIPYSMRDSDVRGGAPHFGDWVRDF